MEAIKLEGKMHGLGITEEKGDKKFKVRELILEADYDSQYPQYINIQATGDKCDKIDDLAPGSIVTLHVNLRGRLYKDKSGVEKSFNSFDLWKFEINQSAPVNSNDSVVIEVEDSEDLPF